MNRKRVPEEELALAVLQRVVADLREGTRKRKKEACVDLIAGGLDYWIDAVCDSGEAAELIKAELWRLAGGNVCGRRERLVS